MAVQASQAPPDFRSMTPLPPKNPEEEVLSEMCEIGNQDDEIAFGKNVEGEELGDMCEVDVKMEPIDFPNEQDQDNNGENDIEEAAGVQRENSEGGELSEMCEVDVKTESIEIPDEETEKPIYLQPRTRRHTEEKKEWDLSKDSNLKPTYLWPRKRKHTFPKMIAEAINSSDEKMLPLSGIYVHINKEHPQYRMEDRGWKNSIRHNLTINPKFQKAPGGSAVRGNYWMIKDGEQNINGGLGIRNNGKRYYQNTSTSATGKDDTKVFEEEGAFDVGEIDVKTEPTDGEMGEAILGP